MRRNTAWLRRWASLSALTSAAIAAGSTSGEAAIIYHGLHGVGPNAVAPLPGGNWLSVSGARFASGTGYDYNTHFRYGRKSNVKTIFTRAWVTHYERGTVRAGGVSFRTKAATAPRGQALIALAKKGQTFRQVGVGAGSGLLGFSGYKTGAFVGRYWHLYGPPVFASAHDHRYKTVGNGFRRETRERVFRNVHDGVGSSGFTRYTQQTRYTLAGYGKEYALFTFDVGSQTDYGWLELSLGGSFGPLVRLIGYAYDTTGQPISAGAIPEPKHLPLALGALALGAIGVREWRAKRKAAA
jgi:hypothetical protein